MTDSEITQLLEENNLILCKDNIIRRKKDNHPACPNYIIQPLGIMKQDFQQLSPFQEKIYGACILSLVEIVLNNKHYRYQLPEIKDELRGEMLIAFDTAEKYFDREKGSTWYSYLFRVMYTNGVHVLERHNAEKEFMEKVKEAYEEQLSIENSGRKTCTTNIDN